ncbi:MAG: RluA family pseudouridine synthase [Elusimicrobiota bacterium]
MKHEKIIISMEFKGRRLDAFLSKNYPQYSRTYFKNLIKDSHVLVNKKGSNAGYHLRDGDEIEISLIENTQFTEIIPQNIPLNIIFEDDEIVVLNKPAGMVVHPACGNTGGTLVNALVYHFKDLPASKDNRDPMAWIRPGLVHRLDKDTSGIMIVAKTEKALSGLARQFNNRTIEKIYLAIVKGKLKSTEGIIDASIGRHAQNRKKMTVTADTSAKPAITKYKVVKSFKDDINLLEVTIKTGRTHQIRVHLKYIGLPILGDPVYGVNPKMFKGNIKRPMLHSYKLGFTHPLTNERMYFEAEIPEDFQSILKIISE